MLNPKNHMKFKSAFFAAIALLLPSIAFALGVRLVDQDAAATARGDAFTATADNPSAIYYNPAGITQLDGFQARVGVYGIGLDVHVSPKDGDGFDSEEKALFLPQLYATYKPHDGPITLGLGVYSPYGLELRYPDTVPFRTLAEYGKIEFLTVNPVIAVQVSRTFSVAVGLTIDQAQADLERGIAFPASASFLNGRGNLFGFKGDGTAVGFNAGVLWQPTPQHSFGLSYHSGVAIDFSGHSNAHLSDKQINAANKVNSQIRTANNAIRSIRALPVPRSVQDAILAANGLPTQPIASVPTSFPGGRCGCKFSLPAVCRIWLFVSADAAVEF